MKLFKLKEGNSTFLDLVRVISSQLVVIGHGITILDLLKYPKGFDWLQNFAVLIFFILSGFLITYSTVHKHQSEKRYDFQHYFIDRFTRIYTTFIPIMLFVALIDFTSILLGSDYQYKNSFNFWSLLGNLFMLQDFPIFKDFLNITSFGSARPFWTLAIEWWIYMLFGLVFFRINRIFRNPITYIFFAICLIVPFSNLIGGRGNGLTLYWLMGALAFYMLSSDLLERFKKKSSLSLLIVVIISALGRLFVVLDVYDPIFAALIFIALTLCIYIFDGVKFNRATTRIIKFTASYSYTLYLLHYTILMFLIINLPNLSNWETFTLFVVLSNLIALLVGYSLEILLTKKIKNFFYSKIS
ncbi:MAG: acyltransferase [Cyclobacteriaceae bacterium]